MFAGSRSIEEFLIYRAMEEHNLFTSELLKLANIKKIIFYTVFVWEEKDGPLSAYGFPSAEYLKQTQVETIIISVHNSFKSFFEAPKNL